MGLPHRSSQLVVREKLRVVGLALAAVGISVGFVLSAALVPALRLLVFLLVVIVEVSLLLSVVIVLNIEFLVVHLADPLLLVLVEVILVVDELVHDHVAGVEWLHELLEWL